MYQLLLQEVGVRTQRMIICFFFFFNETSALFRCYIIGCENRTHYSNVITMTGDALTPEILEVLLY